LVVHEAVREGSCKEKTMKLWILVHEHKHGIDLFPTRVETDDWPDIDPADRIAQGGSVFEPDLNESAEWYDLGEIENIPLA